jgi:hypothetical protein
LEITFWPPFFFVGFVGFDGLALDVCVSAGLNSSFKKLFEFTFDRGLKKAIWTLRTRKLDLRKQVLDLLHGLWRVQDGWI